MADVLGEDVVNGGIGQEDRLAADGHDVITAEVIDDGNADEPREEGAGGNDGGVAKTCEVADAEEGCVVVEAKGQLIFIGRRLAPRKGHRRQDFLPPAEAVKDEVVGHGQEAAEDHDFRLGAFVAAQDFSSGPARREGIGCVHFFAEVAAEGRGQEDAEDAAEDDGNDHFGKDN